MSPRSGARAGGRRPVRLIASALAAALSLVPAGGARDDEETIEELSLEEMLGVVEGATRCEEPVARAPAAVTTITAGNSVVLPIDGQRGANASAGVIDVVRESPYPTASKHEAHGHATLQFDH